MPGYLTVNYKHPDGHITVTFTREDGANFTLDIPADQTFWDSKGNVITGYEFINS